MHGGAGMHLVLGHEPRAVFPIRRRAVAPREQLERVLYPLLIGAPVDGACWPAVDVAFESVGGENHTCTRAGHPATRAAVLHDAARQASRAVLAETVEDDVKAATLEQTANANGCRFSQPVDHARTQAQPA